MIGLMKDEIDRRLWQVCRAKSNNALLLNTYEVYKKVVQSNDIILRSQQRFKSEPLNLFTVES